MAKPSYGARPTWKRLQVANAPALILGPGLPPQFEYKILEAERELLVNETL